MFWNEVSAFVKCKRKVVVDESFNKGKVHATRSQVKNETQDIFFSKQTPGLVKACMFL